MSYNYTSFQQALALEMAIPNANYNDVNFQAILPTIIDYAEQRCYRDLDLLANETVQWFPMVTGTRAQSYAASSAVPSTTQQILIIDRVRIAPQGSVPNLAAANPLYPSTVDYIDGVYSGVFPDPGVTGVPETFAVRDNLVIVFGPAPDQNYFFEIQGQARPLPLSATNTTTFLTQVLPDLFLAAAMVSAMGYRHNFGAQSDDPRTAISWEGQFQELLSSAKNEEMRKRFLGWGMMSSYAPPPSPPPPPGASPPGG